MGGIYRITDPLDEKEHCSFSNNEKYEEINQIKELIEDATGLSIHDIQTVYWDKSNGLHEEQYDSDYEEQVEKMLGKTLSPAQKPAAGPSPKVNQISEASPSSGANTENHCFGAELTHGAYLENGDGSCRVGFHVSNRSTFEFAYFLLVSTFITLFILATSIKPLLLPGPSNLHCETMFDSGTPYPPKIENYDSTLLYRR